MVTSLSLPPFNYLIINFLIFTFFFIFLIKKSSNSKNKKFFFLYGWLFGLGYFISNLYWISISLTFDQSFKFLIPLTIFLIPAFLAIFYGLISYFFILFKPKKIISSFLFFSLIFGVFEFVRGTILTGFPWNLIAYSFSNYLEILSITSVIGTYGFNLFCISLFTSPAIFFLREDKKDIGVFIIFLITPIIFYIYGSFYEEKFNTAHKITYDYKVRAISSNISIDRFYSNIDSISVIEDLIKISNPNETEKTIFVWPEGILPDILQQELIEYSWLFKKSFNKNHILVIGINSESKNNGSKNYFNSFSIYDNELNLLNFYNKINLVPFGEFLPLENFLNKIGMKKITPGYSSFSNGRGESTLEFNFNGNSLKLLPLICYEIIFPNLIEDNTNKYNFIVNISEDAWFGESIGPYQHFAKAILRSIESRKFVIRSANKGKSVFVDPNGKVIKSLEPIEAGNIELELPLLESTKKQYKKSLIFYSLLITYVLTFFVLRKFKI